MPISPSVPTLRQPVTLASRWIWPARLLIVLLAIVAIAVAQPWTNLPDTSFVENSVPGFPRGEVVQEGLGQLGIAPRTLVWGLTALSLAEVLLAIGIAGLLLWRCAREATSLLICIFLITSSWATYPPDLATMAETEPTRALLDGIVTTLFPTSLVLLLFMFPDGRFTPRWTALPVGVILLGWMYEFFLHPASAMTTNVALDIASLAVVLVLAVFAQIYRYRRVSGPIARRQSKWFAVGISMAFGLFVVANVILEATDIDQPDTAPVRALLLGLLALILMSLISVVVPVTLAISLLRFQLFDIDLVINRTLVYSGLTAAIVGLYIAIVGGLSVRLHTGRSLLVSLIATGIVAVIFQPLRDWLQRSVNHLLYGQRDEPYAVLTRLGRNLGGTLAPAAVAPTIVVTVTDALHLPYAAIALRAHGQEEIVAEVGSPGAIVALPLVYQGETLGDLQVSPRAGESLGREDRRLLEDLTRQIGPALHAAQLTSDLQRSRERLVLAREEERRRLRRDLHDGLGPRLAGLTLRLEVARDRLHHDPLAGELLDDLSERTRVAVDDIRRLVDGLRPPALDDLGLVGALRQTVQPYESASLTIAVDVPDALPALPAAVEVAAFRIAEEALTNVVRHADARRCLVSLTHAGGNLIVLVEDDGHGIPANRTSGVGLVSLRERAAELGGSCVIESRPDGGTRVHALLPCRTDEGQDDG
ncbi:MAG: GAF domain-containing sensor histidine kinase [Thermomicrobiales bacterium]|nr:GAF domain-containing sensor histidine kinase [Thermomicrobiales bacterium]